MALFPRACIQGVAMTTTFVWYLLLAAAIFVSTIAQDDLEVRVTNLEVDVVDIKTDVDNVESAVIQNTGQIFEVENDVDDIDDLTSAQELRILELEGEVTVLQARLNVVEPTLQLVRDNLLALNTYVTNLENATNWRFGDVESDVMTLQGDVIGLSDGVTSLESDVTTLDTKVATIETDLSGLEHFVEALNDTVSGIEVDDERLDALESDVIRLEGDVTDLNESTDQRLTALEQITNNYADTAFLVSFTGLLIIPTGVIRWSDPILNSGGHYNPGTGFYTVPVDGLYQFVMHYRANDDELSGAYLVVDGIEVAFTYAGDNDYAYSSADLVVTLSLTSGQEVWIQTDTIDGMYGKNSDGTILSWFSGHLLYPL